MYYVSKSDWCAGKPLCRACGKGCIEWNGSAEKVKGPAPKGVKCALCGYALSYDYDESTGQYGWR
jgi:hypothetical protein